MPLSSKQILDLIPPKPKAGLAGQLEGARRFAPGANHMGQHVLTSFERQFLADIEASQSGRVRPENYTHPGTTAHMTIRGDGPLTPTELAWLDRLPRDPAEVSYQDARALAGLAQALGGYAGINGRVSGMRAAGDDGPGPKATSADLRLVRAVWDPVRELHDRKQAEVNLANASASYPTIPASTEAALADAIHRENGDVLTREEAVTRAARLVRDARQARADQQARDRYQAETQLAAVNQAARDRVAVTA
jgi:hypothetical protein